MAKIFASEECRNTKRCVFPKLFVHGAQTDTHTWNLAVRITTVESTILLRILQIIDSGDQPQFHEILPIFLRQLYFYVFVFRLCNKEINSKMGTYASFPLNPVNNTSDISLVI